MPRSGQSSYRYEGEWETVSFEGASPASADARMAGSYAAMDVLANPCGCD